MVSPMLGMPIAWSWHYAFAGVGTPPSYVGGPLVCACRRVPEVFQITSGLGYFGVQQPRFAMTWRYSDGKYVLFGISQTSSLTLPLGG